MKRIFSFLVFLILINSCATEFKSATFETTTIDIAFEADIMATYDKAIDNNELSKTINTNIENAIISTLNSSKNKTNLDTVLHLSGYCIQLHFDITAPDLS